MKQKLEEINEKLQNKIEENLELKQNQETLKNDAEALKRENVSLGEMRSKYAQNLEALQKDFADFKAQVNENKKLEELK